MGKLAKKTVITLMTCLMAICAFFGICIVKNNTQTASAASAATETSLTGVQLRADVGSSQYYLVLAAGEYASVTAGTAVSNPSDYADLLSNITFYALAEDTTGVSATSLCNTSGWVINQWGSGGLMISMSAENYETYSGSSVYKIVVNSGAIMPYTSNDLKVKKTTTFTNNNYGSESVKYGSFEWTAIAATDYIDTTVTAFGDPDTANRAVGMMWFTLSNHDYAEYNIPVVASQLSMLNLGSKIKITVDGVETTLADNNFYAAYTYRFARQGQPIALYSSITDYTTIEKITIEAGCEFPSQATANNTSGFTLYRTTKDVTFYNDGTGNFILPNNYINTAVTAFGDPAFVENVASESNLWFTLSTHDYVTGNNPVNATQTAALNAYSKIKITVDGVEKTLSEYTVEGIYLNKWGRTGSPLAFQLSGFDYRTIEKITIEKGCEFPSEATANATTGCTLYRTTEDVTFVNDGTGNFVLPNKYINTAVTAFGDPDPANRQVDALWFTLSNQDYTVANTPVESAQLSKLNLGSKIKFTVGGVEKTLSEDNLYLAHLYRYEREGKPIALFVTTNDYTAIEKITIEAGCEFPSMTTATKGVGGGYTLYRTTETVTFINDGTGAFLTVEAAQTAAKAELAAYKNAADYREAEQLALAAILNEANAEIESKDSVAAMNAVVATAKAAIDELKTNAQYEAEEAAAALAAAKTNAKESLETYKNEEDYRDAEIEVIGGILQNAWAEIDACADEAAINEIVEAAKAEMDEVKTKAEYEAEEDAAAALATAKADAKAELAAYKNAGDYREAEKAELAGILENANTAIDACADETAIAEAVTNAKAAMDVLKTDAQYTEEENQSSGDDNTSDDPADGNTSDDPTDGNTSGDKTDKPDDPIDSEEPTDEELPSIGDEFKAVIDEFKAMIPGCSGVVGGIAGGIAALGVAVVALIKKKED